MLKSDSFRTQCLVLRNASLGILAGLVLLLIVSSLSWHPTARAADNAGTLALLAMVRLLPAVGYLWALWSVQRALADLAAGHLFQQTVARAMRQIGVGVLIGALLNVFAVTNLSRWIAGGHGGYMYFDLSGIVLGVVGAALVLLARLIDYARRLQTELEHIL